MDSKAGSINQDSGSVVQGQPMRQQDSISLSEAVREQSNDSLISRAKESFIRKGDYNSISSLDSIARLSDGSLATDISYATTELFHKNFKGFIEFIYAHPKSALLQHFVYGMSEELVAYGGQERELKIKEMKDFAKAQCQEAGYDQAKVKFVDNLLNKINPAIFD